MKYVVRSNEGELTFQSFGEVEQAYWSGLVDPTDEIREEGSSRWRRADAFSVLRRARPMNSQERQAQQLWLALGVVLGAIALWGVFDRKVGNWRYGVALVAGALLAGVLGRLARTSHRKKR